MESIETRIEKAWSAKINLEHEEALQRLACLKQELAFPAGQLVATQIDEILKRTDRDRVLDVLLLSASLSRVLGNAGYGDDVVRAIESRLEQEGVAPGFRLCYEKGMGAFLQGNFACALEEFLRASFFAISPIHRLWALVNGVFCMENLGLPYEQTLAQVRSLVDSASPSHDLTRVSGQLHALELRSHFRSGRLRQLFERESKRSLKKLDQGRYFGLWVKSLPYHAYHERLKPDEVAGFSSTERALHHPAFKLRTLQGMLHPDDFKVAKPSEWIDRVYLWTWWWLSDPGGFPVERVLTVLREIRWSECVHRCSIEDAALLRNALEWLALFDCSAESKLAECFTLLHEPRGHDGYPILRVESHLIRYVRALRDGDRWLAKDFKVALSRDPLWKSRELRFRQVAEEGGGWLASVRSLLQERAGGGTAIVVDMGRAEVRNSLHHQRVVSEPMCLALQLLRTEGTVSCERFVEVCFGLPEFDPLIHMGKIFNLLSRLKKVIGTELRFQVKSGRVVTQGSWEEVEFRKETLRLNLLPVLRQWQATLEASRERMRGGGDGEDRRAGVDPTEIRRWDWSRGLSRREIEQLLERPRSTTNRYVKKWVRDGLIVAKGKARRSRYFLPQGGNA